LNREGTDAGYFGGEKASFYENVPRLLLLILLKMAV
jgi:hypothetical protein